MTLPGEVDPSMQQKELLEHFDTRIDDLRQELLGDNEKIIKMLDKQCEYCKESMKDQGNDIKALQAHKNMMSGGMILCGFLVTVLIALIGLKGWL